MPLDCRRARRRLGAPLALALSLLATPSPARADEPPPAPDGTAAAIAPAPTTTAPAPAPTPATPIDPAAAPASTALAPSANPPAPATCSGKPVVVVTALAGVKSLVDKESGGTSLRDIGAAAVANAAFRRGLEIDTVRVVHVERALDELTIAVTPNDVTEHLGVTDPCARWIVAPTLGVEEASWEDDKLRLDTSVELRLFTRDDAGGFVLKRTYKNSTNGNHMGLVMADESPLGPYRRQVCKKPDDYNQVIDLEVSGAPTDFARCKLSVDVAVETRASLIELKKDVRELRKQARLVTLPGGGLGVQLGKAHRIARGDTFVVSRAKADGTMEERGFAKVVDLDEGGGSSRVRLRLGSGEVGDEVDEYPREGSGIGMAALVQQHTVRGDLGPAPAFGGGLTMLGDHTSSMGWPSEAWIHAVVGYARDRDSINYLPIHGGWDLVFHLPRYVDFFVSPGLDIELAFVEAGDLVSGKITNEWTVGLGGEAGFYLLLSREWSLRVAGGGYYHFRDVKVGTDGLGDGAKQAAADAAGVADIAGLGGDTVNLGKLHALTGDLSIVHRY